MQPFRPGTRPSCSWWPRPPQTPGPKSKLSHPSVQPGRVARFAAQTAAGAPCPHLPSRLDAASLPSVLGSIFVRAFLLREIIQKLADAGVLGTCCGSFIEPASFDFDSASLLANSVEPQRTHQPDRRALDESFHVLAANKRDVLTKFLLVEFNQTTAVSRLFLSHAVEHRSGRGKILAQSFGKICIHALVFFFQRNGQSENLAFRQLVEVLHGAIRLPMCRLGSKPRRLNRRGRRERPPRRRSFMFRGSVKRIAVP